MRLWAGSSWWRKTVGRPRAIRYRATASLAAIMHSSTSECAGVWPSRWIPATRSPAKVTTGSGEEASSAPGRTGARAAPRATRAARARSASSPGSPSVSPAVSASTSG